MSKLFNCFDEKSFIVKIKRNDTEEINLTKELQYSGISKEFEWDIESIVKEIDDEYQYKNCLKGKILSTKKPMDQSLRGITLYVNGRLANVAGFFGVPEAGYVFSYSGSRGCSGGGIDGSDSTGGAGVSCKKS